MYTSYKQLKVVVDYVNINWQLLMTNLALSRLLMQVSVTLLCYIQDLITMR